MKQIRMAICILAIALLFASADPLPAQQKLVEILTLALQNSATVRLAQADVDKAAAQLAQAHNAYIPNLTVGSGIGDYFGFSPNQSPIFSASSQSLVFSFSHREEQASACRGLDAAKLNLKDAREQVILDTATSYARIQTLTGELAALDLATGYGDQLVEIVRLRTEAGLSSRSEYTQTQLTAASLRLQSAHLENERSRELQHLAGVVRMPLSSLQIAADVFPDVPRPQSHRNPPSVLAAAAAADAKKHLAMADERQIYLPQFFVAQQYNRYANYNNLSNYYRNFQSNGYGFGIEISIPLFDAVKRAKGHESSAEALHSRIEAEQALAISQEHVAELENNLKELEAAVEVASLKQTLAKDQLDATLALAESGNGQPNATQTSPKEEKQSRIEERQRLVDALDAGFNLIKLRLGLLRATGGLEEWFVQLSR